MTELTITNMRITHYTDNKSSGREFGLSDKQLQKYGKDIDLGRNNTRRVGVVCRCNG